MGSHVFPWVPCQKLLFLCLVTVLQIFRLPPAAAARTLRALLKASVAALVHDGFGHPQGLMRRRFAKNVWRNRDPCCGEVETEPNCIESKSNWEMRDRFRKCFYIFADRDVKMSIEDRRYGCHTYTVSLSFQVKTLYTWSLQK